MSTVMTATEVREMLLLMKEFNVDRFKCGDLEVHFGLQSPAVDVPLPEVMDEEVRDAVLDDVKGKLQRVMKAQDADLFYSV